MSKPPLRFGFDTGVYGVKRKEEFMKYFLFFFVMFASLSANASQWLCISDAEVGFQYSPQSKIYERYSTLGGRKFIVGESLQEKWSHEVKEPNAAGGRVVFYCKNGFEQWLSCEGGDSVSKFN